jgi:hypothetical protein
MLKSICDPRPRTDGPALNLSRKSHTARLEWHRSRSTVPGGRSARAGDRRAAVQASRRGARTGVVHRALQCEPAPVEVVTDRAPIYPARRGRGSASGTACQRAVRQQRQRNRSTADSRRGCGRCADSHGWHRRGPLSPGAPSCRTWAAATPRHLHPARQRDSPASCCGAGAMGRARVGR